MLQHQTIDSRQVGRIIADRILNQQDRLHPDPENIVIGIHPILNQFDNGQNQIGISVPTKDIVNGGTIFMFNAAINIFRIVDQQHERQISMQSFQLLGKMEHIQISDIKHTDHQVEIIPLFEYLNRFSGTTYTRKRWRVTQIQLHVFAVDLDFESSVFFKGICIVTTANQQNTANTATHQIVVVDTA